MRKFRRITSLLFVGAIAAATLCTGCTVHAGYYDPYYHNRGNTIRIAITGN